MAKSKIPLSELLATCEELHSRQGYVTWSQVARAYGVSRQAIQLRLRAAVAAGHLSAERYRDFQSTSSLLATAREAGKGGATVDPAPRFTVSVSPEDALWLRTEAAAGGVRPSDILAGLLRRARCAAAAPRATATSNHLRCDEHTLKRSIDHMTTRSIQQIMQG